MPDNGVIAENSPALISLKPNNSVETWNGKMEESTEAIEGQTKYMTATGAKVIVFLQ